MFKLPNYMDRVRRRVFVPGYTFGMDPSLSERVLHRVLVMAAVLIALIQPLTVVRGLEYGWRLTDAVQSLGYLAIVGPLFLRRQVSFPRRLGIVIVGVYIVSGAELLTWGLYSPTFLVWTFLAIFIGLIFGTRFGFAVAGIETAIFAAIAVLLQFEVLSFNFDPAEYGVSALAWSIKVLVFLMIILALLGVFALIRGELERSLEELREEQEVTEAAVRAQRDIFILFDPVAERAIRWNDRVRLVGGYSDAEIESMAIPTDMLNEDEQESAAALIERTVAEGRGIAELNVRHSDGHLIPVEVVTSMVADRLGNLKYIVAVGRDLSDRARAMAERRELELKLHQSEKMQAIGQLAGGIAHDFNNQLAGIMGGIELIRSEVQDNPELLECADLITLSARRAADLTTQLLAFARKGKYLAVEVDLHQILKEVIGLMERGVNKNVRIATHLGAPAAMTNGDPSQIQNAFLNLGLNARDAMPGGGTLTFSTELVDLDAAYCEGSAFGVAPGPYVRVDVVDTGVGMEPKVQKRVFEPFFTTKGVGKGTGMGLAAVHGTVTNHLGAVELHSEIGVGSRFSVFLPLSTQASKALEPADVPQTVVSGPAPQVFSNPRGVVMVVDDESVLRDLTRRMLRMLNCQAQVFGGGAEALAYYRDHWRQVDLVILDMIMPGMDGPETFAALREVNPDAQVLIMSGYSLSGKAEQLVQDGAVGFMQKPFTHDDLLLYVNQTLPASSS